MRVKILKKVAVAMNGSVEFLTPDMELDTLSDFDVDALVRGGDAIVIESVTDGAVVGNDDDALPKGQGKNRGAAPRNK